MANSKQKIESPAPAAEGSVIMQYTGDAAAPVPYRVGGSVYRGDTQGNLYVEVAAADVEAMEQFGVFKVYQAPEQQAPEQQAPEQEQQSTSEPEVRTNIVDGASGLPVVETQEAAELQAADQEPTTKRSRR